MAKLTDEEIRTAVVETYGRAARNAGAGCGCSCSGGSDSRESGGRGTVDDSHLIGRSQYGSGTGVDEVPEAALVSSLGCGNPTALAELRPGETVLDLGSGGGLDVLLSARRVGPTGKAYGVDVTPDMLELALRNQAEAGVENAEFLAGRIEQIPLPDGSVDVIISNCVVNLSPDKPGVFREAFRVLRPGGRLAISDIVLNGPLPEPLDRMVAMWTGCIGGALVRDDLVRILADHGFVDADVEVVQTWDLPEQPELEGLITSSFVRARKPGLAEQAVPGSADSASIAPTSL